jgi:hypothetical protein
MHALKELKMKPPDSGGAKRDDGSLLGDHWGSDQDDHHALKTQEYNVKTK